MACALSRRRHFLIWMGLVNFLATIGCERKPPTPADVAISTQAVVAVDGKQVIERGQCGPVAKEETRDEFHRVWQALPPRLQLEFPNRPEFFTIERSAANKCRNEVFPSGSIRYYERDIATFEACWQPKQLSGKATAPVIIVQNDPKSLNTHLIPMTVTAYFEYYVDDLFGAAADQALASGVALKKGEQQIKAFIDDLRRARWLLAKAFIDDLKSKTELIKEFEARFRTSSGLLSQSIPFQNYVIGQLVDAYYCNSNTVRQFNENALARTRGAFMPIVDFLGAPWYASGSLAAH